MNAVRIFLLASGLLLLACASTRTYTLDTLPEQQLVFTFGGGITGEYTSYLLLPNGQLFSRRYVSTPTSYYELEPVDGRTAKELFTTFKKQNFASLGYDDPGSMSYSITYRSPEGEENLTWGGSQHTPPTELKSYWRRVMSIVSDKKQLTEAAKE